MGEGSIDAALDVGGTAAEPNAFDPCRKTRVTTTPWHYPASAPGTLSARPAAVLSRNAQVREPAVGATLRYDPRIPRPTTRPVPFSISSSKHRHESLPTRCVPRRHRSCPLFAGALKRRTIMTQLDPRCTAGPAEVRRFDATEVGT
jgi:hypothetical protein